MQGIEARIPGLSQTLPAKIDPLGQEAHRETGVLGAVNQVLPTSVRKVKTNDGVLNALGQYEVTIGGFARKVGESQKDYKARAQQSGERRRQEIQATLDSQEWADDTSFEGRQQLLKDALNRASRETARTNRVNQLLRPR